jgi:helix-turn-helix protein
MENMIYSTAKVAEFLNVDSRTIQRLAKEKKISKVKHGKYDLKQVVHEYLNYRLELMENKYACTNMGDAQLRKTTAEAEIKEIELSILKKTFVDINKVNQEIQKIINNTKNKFLAMPSKLSPRLISISSARKINNILGDEVYKVLAELSEMGKK